MMTILSLDHNRNEMEQNYNWKESFLNYIKEKDSNQEERTNRVISGNVCDYCGGELKDYVHIGENNMCMNCREELAKSKTEIVNIVNAGICNFAYLYGFSVKRKLKIQVKKYRIRKKIEKKRQLFQNNNSIKIIKKRKFDKVIIPEYMPKHLILAYLTAYGAKYCMKTSDTEREVKNEDGLILWMVINYLFVTGYKEFAARLEEYQKNQDDNGDYKIWYGKTGTPLTEKRVISGDLLTDKSK